MLKILSIFLILSISLYAKIDTETFARWMVNSGDLLVEKGKYLEAIDAYDTALESTNNTNIKIDTIIRHANVLIFYLDQKKEAQKLFQKVYTKYPNSKQSEYALYQAAMLAKEFDISSAIKLFQKYLDRYPNGRYGFQAKYFIKKYINYVKQKKKKPKKYIETVKTPNKTYQGQKLKPSKPKKKVMIANAPTIRILLKKNLKKVHLKGRLNLNHQNIQNIEASFKQGYITYHNQKFRKILIHSKIPIYIKEKHRSYLGSVLLVATRYGINVINLVDMTHYIYGVVTSESYNSWKLEALKAQAVASRTYAYYQTMVRKNWSYDVRDNTFDQVYKGVDGITRKAKLATNATLGEILFYHNKPILAQYTANSGWYSSSSKEIFNTNLPYLYSHRDNFSVKMPDGKWVKKISATKLEKNLRRLGIRVIGIEKVLPYKLTKSGRITKVKIVAKNGKIVLRAYNSIRKAAHLKDTLMNIEKRGDMFYFYGGGFGHGVGYSQWGSQAMAKAGYNYKKILQFYYKNCQIKKMWKD